MDLYAEALSRFDDVYGRAANCGVAEPSAVTLATADAGGRPSARTVLLKHFDQRGFVFYTNLRSRKGIELQANPRAALCFFWLPLAEQVHVEGIAAQVPDDEADAYWRTRDRESQIGAWASLQSEPLQDRDALEQRVQQFESDYEGKDVPRPTHWSGFCLVPNRIEFWCSGAHRLHERTEYTMTKEEWSKTLLFP